MQADIVQLFPLNFGDARTLFNLFFFFVRTRTAEDAHRFAFNFIPTVGSPSEGILNVKNVRIGRDEKESESDFPSGNLSVHTRRPAELQTKYILRH